MFVAKQLQDIWACRAVHLQSIYEQCLILLESLRQRPRVLEVVVEHVYREFNGDADGLANEANEAIDLAPTRTERRVIIDDGWTKFDDSPFGL